MLNYPQTVAKINSQVIHKGYPEPVEESCGKTGGQPVENQGITGGQPGKTPPKSTPTAQLSTVRPQWVCIKNGLRPGKTTFST